MSCGKEGEKAAECVDFAPSVAKTILGGDPTSILQLTPTDGEGVSMARLSHQTQRDILAGGVAPSSLPYGEGTRFSSPLISTLVEIDGDSNVFAFPPHGWDIPPKASPDEVLTAIGQYLGFDPNTPPVVAHTLMAGFKLRADGLGLTFAVPGMLPMEILTKPYPRIAVDGESPQKLDKVALRRAFLGSRHGFSRTIESEVTKLKDLPSADPARAGIIEKAMASLPYLEGNHHERVVAKLAKDKEAFPEAAHFHDRAQIVTDLNRLAATFTPFPADPTTDHPPRIQYVGDVAEMVRAMPLLRGETKEALVRLLNSTGGDENETSYSIKFGGMYASMNPQWGQNPYLYFTPESINDKPVWVTPRTLLNKIMEEHRKVVEGGGYAPNVAR
jgi:hypothetical protein